MGLAEWTYPYFQASQQLFFPNGQRCEKNKKTKMLSVWSCRQWVFAVYKEKDIHVLEIKGKKIKFLIILIIGMILLISQVLYDFMVF